MFLDATKSRLPTILVLKVAFVRYSLNARAPHVPCHCTRGAVGAIFPDQWPYHFDTPEVRNDGGTTNK